MTLYHHGARLEITEQEAEALTRLRLATLNTTLHRGGPVLVRQEDEDVWLAITGRYEAMGVPARYVDELGYLLFRGTAIHGV